ncbi:alpha-L-arabinofuranosidase C-terminal domain-containing protein [Clostridium oryzae]|uniref:non-reducing end alpha-L-arabinofuranosidase n=1 Tax=Clostridium oryzae TaxID=1450648 RepID=A0A1V4IC22_9CLOT|nr:alpha-L-arabinofuranosidase C-terminal domain-containing protein [Clostridium oryzae]OPJ57552.1 extracellular exo-alpha-L-arabinofuranosidase precursor [Clostridium oryzae]
MKIKITDKNGAAINKKMIGLFFEDINYGLDGGLNAEMIENRSFEFLESSGYNDNYKQTFDGLYGWSAYPKSANGAKLNIQSINPQNEINPHYLEFTGTKTQLAFSNKAYDGICMKKGLSYKISFYAKSEDYFSRIEVFIEKDNNIAASTIITEAISKEWTKYQVDLVCEQSISYGTFVVKLSKPGTVCFDFISMIPSDAVLGLFRRDLVGLLKDMQPGFLRFPGGCVIEGNTLDNRYQWKKSIGKAEERKLNWNRWAVHGNCEENNYTSKYSHYNQSLEIGYYEYFLLCEYLGAKPLPVVNVGLACQYQSTELVEVEDAAFQEFITDALDLIEFANGDANSYWGHIRMQMGHPEPFKLEMIGIGNEQWETERVDFFKRYQLFEEAIHEKYPSIKLIGSAGPDITSEKYSSAWEFYHKQAKENADFVYAVDEHYYVKPEWLCSNIHFYDKYPRDVKVFAGEYAAHNDNCINNWGAALSEAAFLTGIERNADVVVLACYAPLFARLGYVQWSPDMIWFDGEHSYGSPSYYVQKMYSTFMGTDVLQVINDEEEIPFNVSYDKEEQAVIVKLVNTTEHTVHVKLDSDFALGKDGEVCIMEGNEHDVNSIDKPFNVVPQKHHIKVEENMDYAVNAKSFHIIKMFIKH